MSIDSILALIDAEIASLTQARSLLGSTGKVETKVAELENQKDGEGRKDTEEEAPRDEPRGAQADCRCAAQTLGRSEVQGQVTVKIISQLLISAIVRAAAVLCAARMRNPYVIDTAKKPLAFSAARAYLVAIRKSVL